MSVKNNNNSNNNNLFSSRENTNANDLNDNDFVTEGNNDTNLESSNIFENTKKPRRKYSQDCLRRKLKGLVLKYAFKFIKEKIKNKNYKNKDIKKIVYDQIKDVKIKSEQNFIYKTLGDIFSDKISARHTTIQEKENYNKKIIDELKEMDTDLKIIFDLTFIQCLNHFMGIKNINALNGLKKFEEIKLMEKKIDEMEEYNLKFISSDYENIINRSKKREREKKKNDVEIFIVRSLIKVI